MKLHNTTDYPDWFLRRMVAWICRQCGHRVRDIDYAEFKFTRNANLFSGYAYSREFRVSIRRPDGECRRPWPTEYVDDRHGVTVPMITRDHGLVAITAHEINHCHQRVSGRQAALRERGNETVERDCHAREAQVVRLFEANREQLLADWSRPRPVRKSKPKRSLQETRAAKAVADLARWERKLKLARTKVAAYRKRVRYYEFVAAKHPPTVTE